MALTPLTSKNLAGEAIPAPATNAVNSKGFAAPYVNAEPGSGLFPTADPLNQLKNGLAQPSDRVTDQDLWDAFKGGGPGKEGGLWGINDVQKRLEGGTDAASGTADAAPAAPIADPFEGLIPDTSLQPGTAVPGAEGLDFLKKGAAESFFDDVSGKFKEPTLSEGYAKDALDKYKDGTPGMTNRADEAYQAFLGSAPADMSKYYDSAKRRAAESIDNKVAARGLYGSSAANDLIRESDENLEADRAGKEAQYGLQRAGLGGQLATSSDASSRSSSDLDRSWQTFLSNTAGQADSSGLSRLLGGMTSAGAAQGAQRTRGQDFFNNNMTMGDALARTKTQGYGSMFGNDKDLFGQFLAGLVGEGTEKQGQTTHDAAQARADDVTLLDKIGNLTKLGTGLNQTFKPTPGAAPVPPQPAYYGPQASDNYGTTNYYDPKYP